MVVQLNPLGGKVARWHYVPGGAGLLPADVSPFSGDIIFNSLVAYPMGAGRIRIAPGKQAGKDGEKTEVEKRCGDLASATLLVEILFHRFPMGNTEIGNVKNWKGHVFSHLTTGNANDALPIWHSSIFVSFYSQTAQPSVSPSSRTGNVVMILLCLLSGCQTYLR